MFANLAFSAPWLLVALIALPVLWLLLRAIPPAPIRRRFPGVALLLGLQDDERQADKTPWWLLVLRALAVGAAIIGFAGPVVNPPARQAGTGPLLVLLDGGWADARDWPRRIDRAQAAVDEAARMGRPLAIATLTDTPDLIAFRNPADWQGKLAGLAPRPFLPGKAEAWAKILPEGGFDTLWLSDGLDHPGQAALMAALGGHGRVTIVASPRPVYALHPARFADGKVRLSASRLPVAQDTALEVSARGPDPSGVDRELARGALTFAPGADRAELALDLPPELRNRLTRFEIIGQRTAGAVALSDDSLKRRKVAIVTASAEREGLQILSADHFLKQALAPTAEVIEGGLSDLLPAKPDVIILPDIARLTQTEQDGVLDWLDQGGLLLRFAGPRLASVDPVTTGDDPLLPVQLREGGRSVGGAMSWDQPRTLAPFAESSPFHGLAVPADLAVTQQVLAQPGPDLADHTIAELTDGTPLVTRKALGQGQVVLFHVTANADWSNLPLSGLFVQMLERLAVSTRAEAVSGGPDLAGLTWAPDKMLDGYGQPADAGQMAGIKGEALAAALTSGPDANVPPGLYRNEDRLIAVNALPADAKLTAATWPTGTVIEGLDAPGARALGGWLMALALALLSVDVVAALALSGRLPRLGRAAAVLVLLALMPLPQARAQTPTTPDPAADARAVEATRGIVLAHVLTGNPQVDDIADAGLRGLGDQLWLRTSVEPEPPMGVDLEKDDLSFYPFLYWPVTADQPLPSPAAYARLNRFLRTGGMILFDTRDGDIAGFGGSATPEAQALQTIAASLDIPPLEPVPKDHVLTRTFYLLQDFPGRFNTPDLWVEAAPPDAEQAEGMPFRNLNDGVTPVIIGGNDWAAAWAVNGDGSPMFPVGRGQAGEDQREIAYRFGVNVIMHVLTGNYKSDQVHVPALLERLGQ
jgi:hypothetical protein